MNSKPTATRFPLIPTIISTIVCFAVTALIFWCSLSSANHDFDDTIAQQEISDVEEIEPSSLPLASFGETKPALTGQSTSDESPTQGRDDVEALSSLDLDNGVDNGATPHQSAPSSTPGAPALTDTITSAQQAPRTIRISGQDIPYIYSYGISYAPESGCGIWKGVSDVNDGSFAFFVGHNPGDFASVMNLNIGDTVSVRDDSDSIRQYTVRDAFTLPQRTTFQDVEQRVATHGESVILQTCCGDNVNIRIVVAY